MQLPLISIIFPIYNVERFVKKSLESIIQQTYQYIEIIVVNDGSTDNGFEICKKLAEKDKRIKLFEQKNQGLSAARNTGIDHANGEYLMFVDSDDWLHKDIISILYNDILDNNVELAMCSFKKVSENYTENNNIEKKGLEVISQKSAIQRMLLGEWWSACMKLYHCSIFENLRFPIGKNNEDYAILVKIFEQCNQVCYNRTELYYYLTRENSITTSSLNERKFDEVQNGIDVLEYVKLKFPEFSCEAERNLAASLIKLIMQVDFDKSYNFVDKQKNLLEILESNYSSFMLNQYIPKKQKVFLFVFRFFNSFLRKLYLKIYQFYS